eukprot:TRINITY_DN10016_c0_g1_i2.p1 TRINITY_DN10016_c0_g1~~TRINITY_DN10016_c0_g1_i2.p1  ORF type:complete len:448 (-),score=84.56 TRINITY_DN10016_c0_g1_i2:403-1746(-)
MAENAWKKKINSNLVFLIENTQFNDLLENKLMETEKFRNMMKSILEETPSKRSGELFKKIINRGPGTYDLIVEALVFSGNLEAAKRLDAAAATKYKTANTAANTSQAVASNNNGNSLEPAMRNLSTSNGHSKVFNPPAYERQPTIANPPSPPVNQSTLVQPPMIQRESLEPLTVTVKCATEFLTNEMLGAYDMSMKPRGKALIINMEDFEDPRYLKRTGSNVDENNLSKLFRDLGFEVEVERNLTLYKAFSILSDLSKNPDLKQAQMLIVCILSHGHNGEIVCADGRVLKNEDILKRFNNENCQYLRGKPKFFVFQACRGENLDYGIKSRTESDGREEYDASVVTPEMLQKADSVFKDPVWEDFLIAYSTLPGYVSQRDRYRGTWFIESLVSVFMENAFRLELSDMLNLVARQLRKYESEKGHKQSFVFENRHFTKKLFFNPGMYKE